MLKTNNTLFRCIIVMFASGNLEMLTDGLLVHAKYFFQIKKAANKADKR